MDRNALRNRDRKQGSPGSSEGGYMTERRRTVRYLVRTSCEYCLAVEAQSSQEALQKADSVDLCRWDSAEWSPYEVEAEEEATPESGRQRGTAR